ncbi:MAG: DNA polymerase III subunit alpha, partial [Oscillospiraceae bacterium]|nr:DNA polymerase III subunit alpha [Oscillospiraceae bacterium]
GCIVYQEQVMQICRKLAGYSYGRADLVRRAMAKKKADVMEKERQNFIYGKKNEDGTVECVGAVANGVSAEIANSIFDEMTSFAAYAFNKSHAAAYAHVSYQTAYLKCHYPREYMAALLTSVAENTDKMIGYIAECQKLGIRVLPPDVNRSEMGFSVEEEGIRFGLPAIKNVGRGLIGRMLAERENGGIFTDLYDFCNRMNGKDLNKRSLESLIRSGAMDCFPHNRRQMLASYENILDSVNSDNRNRVEGQLDLFHIGAIEKPRYEIPSLSEFPQEELLSMEKEMIGLFVSANPLDRFDDRCREYGCTDVSDIAIGAESGEISDKTELRVLGVVLNKKVIQTKNGSKMAFVNLEDKTGVIEITVFPNLYQRLGDGLQDGKVILVQGTVSIKEEEAPKLLCSTLLTEGELGRPLPPLASGQKQAEEILYIRLSDANDPRGKQVMELLDRYRGEEIACFFLADTGQKKKLPFGVDLSKKSAFLPALYGIVTKENVTVKQRK